MAHDIFISYATKDKTIADAVCAGLEKEGVRCWIAPRDILTSEDYDDAIIKGITSARIMVVIFSSNIFQSQFVKSEVERAFSKGLIIAPFRIENVAPEGGLELYLGRKHWLDAMTPPLEAHIQTLATTILLMLAAPPLVPPLAPSPEGATISGPQISQSQPPTPQGGVQPAVQPAPDITGEQVSKTKTGSGQPARMIAIAAAVIGLVGLLCVAILASLMFKNLLGNSGLAIRPTATLLAQSGPSENTPISVSHPTNTSAPY